MARGEAPSAAGTIRYEVRREHMALISLVLLTTDYMSLSSVPDRIDPH